MRLLSVIALGCADYLLGMRRQYLFVYKTGRWFEQLDNTITPARAAAF